jgi:hypothetical protein
MIWSGICWLWQSRQAPWTAINLSAALIPHDGAWYRVRFFGTNDRPFDIELRSLRTIKPKKLLLRRADNNMNPVMRADTEAVILKDLPWVMAQKGAGGLPFERPAFVNLKDRKGDVYVDFEIAARFLDNRRSELPVWVRTNTIKR